MYILISIASLLVSFCLGDSQKPAISSISVHRDDIPLSYKYSAVHLYTTTAKPTRDHNNYQQEYAIPVSHKRIQYAPLTYGVRENNLYTQAIVTNQKEIQKEIQTVTEKQDVKHNLEPRPHNINGNFFNAPASVQPISGYNIEPHMHDHTKYDLLSFLRLTNNQHNLLRNSATEPRDENVLPLKHNPHYAIVNTNEIQNEKPTKTVQFLWGMENAHIQPVLNPFIRTPQLHLNVARSYNFARAPYKAPVTGYTNIQENIPEKELHDHRSRKLQPNYKNSQ